MVNPTLTHCVSTARAALETGAQVRIKYAGEEQFSKRFAVSIAVRSARVRIQGGTEPKPITVPLREGDEFEITQPTPQ